MTQDTHKHYTFTFPKDDEKQFRRILSRLDDDEYSVIEDICPVDKDNPRYSDLQTVMTMDPEAASTFRFGMKILKIKRQRTDEEEAALKEREDRHTVTIKVHTGEEE